MIIPGQLEISIEIPKCEGTVKPCMANMQVPQEFSYVLLQQYAAGPEQQRTQHM
jgi:hypothetical protein